MIKKILAISLIILFFAVTVLPVITAVDYVEDNIENESRINSKIGTPDNYEEIITFIQGWADLNWMERRGYFRGEVILTWYRAYGYINLSGYRRSGSGIEYYNELILEDFVYVYNFIGYSSDYSYFMISPRVVGIAIGNLEWGRIH